MRNKLLSLVLLLQLGVFVFINPTVKSKLKYNINIYKDSNLNNIKLENYVIGVVAAEMPASFSFEALKAQAVAARTFAYKKIINNDINYDDLKSDKGQSYISVEEMKNKWKNDFDKNYDIVSNAVLSTKGEILTFNNSPINAYYFSLSNGKTENSSYVFGEKSYLVSVDSSWDVNNKGFINISKVDNNEFKSKLGITDDQIIIGDINRNETNHVNSIVINNKSFSGIDVRKIFNLRSTDFDIRINNNDIEFTTRGYGHGVGMSQYGANSLATEGKKYDEILKYYYNGVSIDKI